MELGCQNLTLLENQTYLNKHCKDSNSFFLHLHSPVSTLFFATLNHNTPLAELSLSLCLSASLPLCLSASLSLCLSASLSLCLSVSLSLCLSLSLHSRWTLQLSHLAASALETNLKKSSLHLDQQLFAKRCKALFIADCLVPRTMERFFGFFKQGKPYFLILSAKPKTVNVPGSSLKQKPFETTAQLWHHVLAARTLENQCAMRRVRSAVLGIGAGV